METTTFPARLFANRNNDPIPAGSPPKGRTSPTVALRARRPSSARRKAGTVRTTMGLRDIGTRAGWRRRSVLPCRLVAGEADHIKAGWTAPSDGRARQGCVLNKKEPTRDLRHT